MKGTKIMLKSTERLIALVHAAPPLWDTKNKYYHNWQVVDRLWSETAVAVGHYGSRAIKKKWKSLRDQFRSELRKLSPEQYNNLKPGCSLENMPQWPYFKSMLFLKEHMKRRKKPEPKQDPLPIDKCSSHIENVNNNSNETNAKYCIQSSVDMFEVQPLNATQEPLEIAENHEELHKQYEQRASSKKRKRDQNDDNDEDIAFFVSLLPHVRQMDPARKLLCRMEIQSSVYNHAYENDRTGPETFPREPNSSFSENILSTPDHMQFDSKEHVFLLSPANNT